MLVSSREGENATDSCNEKTEKKMGRWQRWVSRDGIINWLLNLTRNAILKSISYFIEINFVLTLASTMVCNTHI